MERISSLPIDSEKSTQSVKTTKAKAPAQSEKPSISNPARSAVSTVAAGLPQDKLSSSIVSFARFFSLSLKPQVLADIRRQVFLVQGQTLTQTAVLTQQAAQPAAHTGTDQSIFKMREAISLSAAAAESKGVELLPKGLESYAEAADPDLRRQNREQKQKKQDREQTEKEEIKTNSISANNIKKSAYDYLDKNPLIDILNKLPGKNGKRWVVFPFDFKTNDMEYMVSVRVLLDDNRNINKTVCLAMDIAEKNNQHNRWLFYMESVNEKPIKLFVYLQDEIPAKMHLKYKEKLSQELDIPQKQIFIKIREESFPYEADSGFSSIDEAV